MTFNILDCIIRVRYLIGEYGTLNVSLQSLIGTKIFMNDSFIGNNVEGKLEYVLF